MAFFGKFKQTLVKAKIATELEVILDSYTRHYSTNQSNSKLASDLVSETYEQLINQSGKLTGTRSEKCAVILAALTRGAKRSDLKNHEKHLFLLAFGDIYSQLKTTNFSGFTHTELKLIEEANEIFRSL